MKYVSGDASLIDSIKPLWDDLNSQHLKLSPYFKSYYQSLTFQARKRAILQRAEGGEVRVDLALDESSERLVGYCVSSLDRYMTGEIDSIFVEPKSRDLGIGRVLMSKALAWLDERAAKKKIVSVAVGNEQVFSFYEQFGFFPRRILLEQIKPEG